MLREFGEGTMFFGVCVVVVVLIFCFDVDYFKVFMEFVTILLLFYVLVFWP